MSSPIFNAMGGSPQGNGPMQMIQQFKKFKQEMQGKNPKEEINKLLQSGKINQRQLDQIQQQARQMQGMFQQFFN